jgi:murein DD-endopeptidase MepM/ murein hydrolase activator NlpD
MIRKISPLIIALIFLLSIQGASFAQSEDENPIYIVQSGENLTQIALKFNISVQELISVNNIINANLISEGTQLLIPGISGISGILTTEPVSFGDSLTSILRKNFLSKENFKKLNAITSPAEVYIGSNLILPQKNDSIGLSNIVFRQTDTLLSSAIRANKNYWEINQVIDDQKVFTPGDALFFPDDTEKHTETVISQSISGIEIFPLPLTQGHTAVVYIYANQPVNLVGQISDRQFSFFKDEENNYLYAFIGIHALAEPGLEEMEINGSFEDGETFSASKLILITDGGYSQESLTVEQTKIDKNIIDNEAIKVDEIVNIVSPVKYWQSEFRFPVDGALNDGSIGFTSYFGSRRSYNNGQFYGYHGGLDFEVRLMSLNIYAPAPGIIVYTDHMDIRGNTIFIDHGQGVLSGYAHLNQFFVNVGDFVETGQLIGEIGQTGRVTGKHLHWDIWVNGNQINPFGWINRQFP